MLFAHKNAKNVKYPQNHKLNTSYASLQKYFTSFSRCSFLNVENFETKSSEIFVFVFFANLRMST